MNLQQFQKLGQDNPVTQNAWAHRRNQYLRRFWKCSCGKKLPIKGFIWNRRWNGFKMDHRLGDDPTSSGYYCDACADAREAGIDY